MCDIGYIAWLRRKKTILENYIIERYGELLGYYDEIGEMAQGMSRFGQLEHQRRQIAQTRDIAEAVDRDMSRKAEYLGEILNEIEPLMKDPAVTIEAIDRYNQENEDLLNARAIEYLETLRGD
jgi:hypothetical protein